METSTTARQPLNVAAAGPQDTRKRWGCSSPPTLPQGVFDSRQGRCLPGSHPILVVSHARLAPHTPALAARQGEGSPYAVDAHQRSRLPPLCAGKEGPVTFAVLLLSSAQDLCGACPAMIFRGSKRDLRPRCRGCWRLPCVLYAVAHTLPSVQLVGSTSGIQSPGPPLTQLRKHVHESLELCHVSWRSAADGFCDVAAASSLVPHAPGPPSAG